MTDPNQERGIQAAFDSDLSEPSLDDKTDKEKALEFLRKIDEREVTLTAWYLISIAIEYLE